MTTLKITTSKRKNGFFAAKSTYPNGQPFVCLGYESAEAAKKAATRVIRRNLAIRADAAQFVIA
jgi:hypothetical protein